MFKINYEDKEARAGKLYTKHGIVETPFFMPIATKGTAKQVSPDELKLIGSQAIIANAFVLHLKPGLEVLNNFKGIHKFMKWDKTIFTDSGGFQILSKSFLHKADEKGVYFKNPFDGSKKFFTPEDIIDIEEQIGSDVAMALDFVPHYGNSKDYIAECTRITHLWAERCLKSHDAKRQLLFGICQGGIFKDLREKSAKFINNLDFDGIALGGLGIGEGRENMFNTAQIALHHIDNAKPRYLMGVGSPEDLIDCVGLGIDCFDSRFPTMNARHGGIFTSQGKINIEKVQYKNDENPLDENCKCPVCKKFSKAFIHHLYRTHEPIRDRYGNIHNLYFIQNLMKDIRKSIKNNEFNQFKKDFFKNYKLNKNKNTKFTYS
ncbi:tRNA guanosine(34) transglycosylase Tgt [Candidatus Woesearchaeota archaeon]|nr:tRNA guanosine(34) transglycosylase Tgt [Candidatus Woesearchaeota archaeon]